MRQIILCLIICPLVLLSGCLPTKNAPSPVSPPPPVTKESPPEAGPYWHGTGSQVRLDDALAYYAALKTLKSEELSHEYQRLIEAAASPVNRLAHLELVLLAVLPDQSLVNPEEATRQLEAARQDADIHRDLGDLLILLDDQLDSRQTKQTQKQQGSQTLRSLRKKMKSQSEELEACRAEKEDLADKLQKLQDIEHSLMDRDRKK
jgi:predicted ribosome quality control (RQC) complex YloA/Tae2 family protein